MARGDITKKIISKSGKNRRTTSYQLDQNKNMIRTRSGNATAFKQVVYLQELGKNTKGKVIYRSITKHELSS